MNKNRIWFYLAILSLLSTSCSKRWCNTHYPSNADTVLKELVRDSIILKDTTIYVSIPGEIIRDSIPIPCPDPGPAYIPKRVYAETSLARASAWWQYPVIKLELIQKDTTIIQRLDNAIKEKYYWKTLYQKITIKPEPVKFVPGFYKFCTFCFIGLLIAGLGFAGFKIFKYFKI